MTLDKIESEAHIPPEQPTDPTLDNSSVPAVRQPPPFPVWVPILLALFTAMSWSGKALLPLFDRVPLLVVFLDPQPYLIPLAVDKVAFWPLLLVATIRLLLADPVWYYLGRYCSEWVLSTKGKKPKKFFKKPRKILEALVDHRENKHLKSKKTRWLIQGTVYMLVLLYATGFVMCAAGILELRRRAVIVLAVIGTSAQVYALMALGTEFL